MAMLPPVTMKLSIDTTEFHASIEEVKKALLSFRPTDYQIRLDALKLTVQMAAANDLSTGEHFAEWQECFESSLRQVLES
jgi:hypothetical protein